MGEEILFQNQSFCIVLAPGLVISEAPSLVIHYHKRSELGLWPPPTDEFSSSVSGKRGCGFKQPSCGKRGWPRKHISSQQQEGDSLSFCVCQASMQAAYYSGKNPPGYSWVRPLPRSVSFPRIWWQSRKSIVYSSSNSFALNNIVLGGVRVTVSEKHS